AAARRPGGGAAAAAAAPGPGAEDAALRRLGATVASLDETRLALLHRLHVSIRTARDVGGADRWLHHRWLDIHRQMTEDLGGRLDLGAGTHYVCVGAGGRNPLALPLLVGLSGASRVTAIEPEPIPGHEEWRWRVGLEEMALRLLAGNVRPPGVDASRASLEKFVDVDALLFGPAGGGVLRRGALDLVPGFFEDVPLAAGSVDLLSSRSVLEHVAEYDRFFDALARVVKEGGWMYHDIDLTSHSGPKDRFRFYREPPPKPGKRTPHRLNELRCSDYVRELEKRGFKCRVAKRNMASAAHLDEARLQPRFRHYSDEDLLCSRVILLAQKET
ncbi:MAG: methyltransferase domain-containing protein, partial [Methanobacteriota archaeon]